MKLIVVTGLSGSGKSIALNTLEDLGYFCVDNLPVSLLSPFAMHLSGSDRDCYRKAAVGIDARNDAESLAELPGILKNLSDNITIRILFLQAEHEVLLKRFSETRRKHPLTGDGMSLSEAIQREKHLLSPISANADMHIDTTQTNLHQLRDMLTALTQGKPRTLSLLFQSFGFKHGAPADADFLFDVRCLPNPHWEAALRPQTGKDPAVQDFLDKHDVVHDMFSDIQGFIERWIPHFEANNRSYMTVAVGCTGGQHRSVYLAEQLAAAFRENREGVLVRHRELG